MVLALVLEKGAGEGEERPAAVEMELEKEEYGCCKEDEGEEDKAGAEDHHQGGAFRTPGRFFLPRVLGLRGRNPPARRRRRGTVRHYCAQGDSAGETTCRSLG